MTPIAIAFQEQRRHAILDLCWRAVGSARGSRTLEVGALRGIAPAALIIDESGYRVRKGPAFRVADTRPSDRVDVEHPAVAEAYQRRVHLAGEHSAFVVAGRLQTESDLRGPRAS